MTENHMSPDHLAIYQKIEEVQAEIKHHIDIDHPQIAEKVNVIEAGLEDIATVIVGPKRSEFLGGGGGEKKALIRQGKIQIRTPWRVWAAIITAIGAVVAANLAGGNAP